MPPLHASAAAGATGRARLRAALTGRPGQTVLLVACALTVAVPIMPGQHRFDFPLDDSAIGQVSGRDIKAWREVRIVNEEATARARQEALAGTLPVFDHKLQTADALAERVRRTFGAARETLAALPPTPRVGGARAKEEARAQQEAALAELRAELERGLQLSLTDGEFQALLEAGFSSAAELALIEVLQRALAGLIVADRNLMLEDVTTGLALHPIPRGVGAIRSLRDLSEVTDVAAVRAAVPTMTRQVLATLDPLPPELARAISGVVERFVRPNLTFNAAETDEQRARRLAAVEPVTRVFKKGERVLSDGEVITARHVAVLRALAAEAGETNQAWLLLGATILFGAALLSLFGYAEQAAAAMRLSTKDLALLALVFVLSVLGTKLGLTLGVALKNAFPGLPSNLWAYAIPSMTGAMLVRFVVSGPAALLFSVALALAVGLLRDGNLSFSLYVLIGSLVAARGVSRARQRTTLLRAGLLAAAANLLVIGALAALSGQPSGTLLFWELLGGLIAGLLSATFVTAVTPAVELLFGYMTDIKLLELANLNHPVLRELMVQAPGSHHHSVIVGTLVEAAAEHIGANPLLARVMAYYHDIGKAKNPKYFAENQAQDNPHDKLAPSMSALILKRHVTDGLKLAEEHRLGDAIAAAISEHHGNTRIGFFYDKAKAAETPDSPVIEADYRYPGHLPQSRETALVMLADSVEAAARSIADPNPARLLGVVQKVINLKFTDGQLNECDLTLRDLHQIARAFAAVLGGIHHSRPEYNLPAAKVSAPARVKQHGSPDQKPKERSEAGDQPLADDGAESLRRLGNA